MNIKVNSQLMTVAEGENLMEAMLRQQQLIPNVCNGRGTCGKCKVRIVKETPAPLAIEYATLSAGELTAGLRLACQVRPREGMEVISGPTGSVDRKEALLIAPEQTSGQCSGVRRIEMDLDPPSLKDERGDWDRLSDKLRETYSLSQPTCSLAVLQTLAPHLRRESFAITAVVWNDEVLAVRPGKETAPVYGVAIDIGTTNIAAALYDLESGRLQQLAAAENSQTRFGADVISRIDFANGGQNNTALLRQTVIGTINELLAKLCCAAGIDSRDIFKAVIVGNTTMHHLFLGLDVSYLALSPFVPVRNAFLELNAAEAGLAIHPQAKVLLFANIGGFVGGDTLGAVLGAETLLTTGRHLLLDIGTNCELYLQDGTRMWACSTAAGPAFEGAGITCGMRAQPGAIERVSINEQGVAVAVIDGGEATGICGSGLIEAIQHMRRSRVISQMGTIADPKDETAAELAPGLISRIREGRQGREFVLSYNAGDDDIVLTQRDISQLQLAKGAVCAGIRTLLAIADLTMDDLDSVILAGTFAAHLNLTSILDIGLIPDISLHKLKTAGNAAHTGAVKALLHQRAFDGLQRRAAGITHVELGGNATFSMYFMDSMYIEPCRL